jgi:hypothetical protein
MSVSGNAAFNSRAAFEVRLSDSFTMRALPHAGSSETIICGFGGQLTRGKILDMRTEAMPGLQPCGTNPVGLSADARNQIGQLPHIVKRCGGPDCAQTLAVAGAAVAAAVKTEHGHSRGDSA